MKFYFPENIFTRSFVNLLPDDEKQKVNFQPSSVLSKSLNDNPGAIGLVPLLDLLSNKEMFVSKIFGLSFEGALSNSYIYYDKNKSLLNKIHLAGDVSSMEVLLAKILFKELYNVDCEIVLQTNLQQSVSGIKVLAGDYNFERNKFNSGISFAEEIVEIISAPYVNFVLSSQSSKALKEYENIFKKTSQKLNQTTILSNDNISANSLKFIKENIGKIIFDFDEQDMIGIKEILKLPYYHGLIKDIVELKFV